ncbi:hypothetical protein [Pseudoruegeria sp. HB172150]|uniref:hypothetical protein n=1 Tax=Pseudoruegeria sp. HB172150 TaxID=2721164 RepID=UPI001555D8FE|nr:hypothetical protein [Pseudoruegeria sp. HB172150]
MRMSFGNSTGVPETTQSKLSFSGTNGARFIVMTMPEGRNMSAQAGAPRNQGQTISSPHVIR